MYAFDSRIRYSECDSEGKLAVTGLLNYFQDCSTQQSEDLGVGVEALHERGTILRSFGCPGSVKELRQVPYPMR